MASTYSPNLRLELIGTGEQQGTWGATTNTNLGTLLEEAIGGYAAITVSDAGDTTLTTANGATDQSRNMTLNLTGTITAARNVICPAIEKVYIVKNATTGGFAVTFKVSGQTGVSIPNGQTVLIFVDGTDARQATGAVANGGTGATTASGAATNLGLGTGDSPQFTAVNIGSATDTTITRVSAGVIAVEGKNVALNGTTETLTTGTIELGAATDTTISRVSAGVIAVEGKNVSLNGTSETLTTGTIELGAATDTTISRVSAGVIAVEGKNVALNGTSEALTTGTIELGAATDTTLSRSAAGVVAVEGNTVPSPASQAHGDILYRGSAAWERLAAGTSGQYLQTAGAGAAPVWATVSTGSWTSLGTISTASGTTVTLSSLTLTSYKALVLVWTGVSAVGNSSTISMNGVTIVSPSPAGSSSTEGWINIDLTTGVGACHMVNSATATQQHTTVFLSGITTASTSVSATSSSGFDAGSIVVYGIK